MQIDYKINAHITSEQFITLLHQSTLAERRPVDDQHCMDGMLNNSNLTITAWAGENLIGIARSLTDFHYACYLSDLAVVTGHQKLGIGKRLQMITKEQLGKHCKLILIAAPAADSYYERLGFTQNPRCWVLDSHKSLLV